MNEHFFLPGLFQARKTLDAVVEMQAAVVKATTTSVYEPPRPAVVLCGDLNSKPRQATCRYLERAELARGDGQELTAELVTSYQWGKSTRHFSLTEMFDGGAHVGLRNPLEGLEGCAPGALMPPTSYALRLNDAALV